MIVIGIVLLTGVISFIFGAMYMRNLAEKAVPNITVLIEEMLEKEE